MQATQVRQRVVFGGTRAIVIAAVAAAGVGIGYWVIPQGDGRSDGGVVATRPTGLTRQQAERITSFKIEQMDRADAAFVPATKAAADARADAIIARKIEQMDRVDAAFVPATKAAADARADAIIARKIEQMDRADAAFGQGEVAGVSTTAEEEEQAAREKARADRIWAIKFRQMEER